MKVSIKNKGVQMKKITSFALSIVASTLLAGTQASIELDPIIDEVVPGKRIVVQAAIEDKAGIDVARTYFKATDSVNYSFVPMECEASACRAVLPAVSASTKSIDYLLLVKNANNEVYKTQTFSAVSLPVGTAMPSYQIEPTDSVIQVKTELAKAPEMVEGFSDNMAIDAVEDSARLGVVVGITQGVGSGAGAAAGVSTTSTAVSAGTVAATGAGIGTTAIVAGGVVAVAAGGAAAASSSGSSSSHSDHYDDHYTDTVTAEGLEGSTYKMTDSAYNPDSYTIVNYTSSSSCTYEEHYSDDIVNGTCTWSLSGDDYTFTSDGGAELSGSIGGNLSSFTVSGHYANGETAVVLHTKQ